MTLAGRDLLLALKAGNAPPLQVGPPPACTLRPVATDRGRLDARDVRCLTEWRNRFVSSFLTEFVATEERTERWLVEQVGPNDTRLLFMADGLDGIPFGYLGISFIDWPRAYGEADAIVRGGPAPPGTMKAALLHLLKWARTDLGLQDLGVRVRSDNPALAFYRKLGFEERRRVPLRRSELSGTVVWSEDPALPSSEKSLVHLRWRG